MSSILVLGASVRAAAASALRAGLSPWGLDLFADSDLRAMCPASRLRGRYPAAFLEEARAFPPGPWMYTGAMENHPALIGRIAAERPLWGIGPDVLALARDPAWLAAHALAAGLPAPRLGTWPPGPGDWLAKPLAGGGGAGVQPWRDDLPPGRWYVQERIEGVPLGVVFCGPLLLGASRQLVGTPWLGADGFRYAGSVGPMRLPARTEDRLRDLGRRLAQAGMRGLFGIDGILRGEEFFPIEANPRYTASVEVLELASGLLALAHHAAAFGAGEPPPVPAPSRLVAKGIVYSARATTFPAHGPWQGAAGDPPPFADIPEAGTPLEAGGPVLTVFAAGDEETSILGELRRLARAVEQALGGDLP